MTNEEPQASLGAGYEPAAQGTRDGLRTRTKQHAGVVEEQLPAEHELRDVARWPTVVRNDPSTRAAPAAECAETRCIDLGLGIRLRLKEFGDGWGWNGWEAVTRRDGWQPYRPPAAQDVARRFGTPTQAARFFALLTRLSR